MLSVSGDHEMTRPPISSFVTTFLTEVMLLLHCKLKNLPKKKHQTNEEKSKNQKHIKQNQKLKKEKRNEEPPREEVEVLPRRLKKHVFGNKCYKKSCSN